MIIVYVTGTIEAIRIDIGLSLAWLITIELIANLLRRLRRLNTGRLKR